VLIATQGYVDLEPSIAQFGSVPADYIIPDQFLPTDGGVVNYADIDALDSGRIPGWSRTGGEFFVYATGGAGLSPVCRFYIPPQHGNSHFFSADPSECARIQSLIGVDPNYSGYILETPAAFHIALPNVFTGACPASTTPVYRLWNARADSNHRYTTDPVVKAQMQAIGYIAEGYGPNAVAMCAPA
jgi:hypothetical protein